MQGRTHGVLVVLEGTHGVLVVLEVGPSHVLLPDTLNTMDAITIP